MTPFWMLVLASFFAAFALMLAVWALGLELKNAGIVDVAWSLNFTVFALFYAAMGTGYPFRKLLVLVMAGFWSLRLGAYLWNRVARHHPSEDARYQDLRRQWAPRVHLKFFLFFQFQGLLNVVLSVPFLVACMNPEPRISVWEWAGLGLWIAAAAGESLADRQLKRFKADPANRNGVCREGLWNYSRHPNYFFEFMIWVSYSVFALGSPHGIWTLYCPALMYYFLTRVTGIPMTEELALRTKGAAYREYQRTTSAFVPWFKRG